jgi:hypothetical protein
LDTLFGGGANRVYLGFVMAGTVITLVTVEALLRTYVVPIANTPPNRVHQVYTTKNPDVILGDSHLYYGMINAPDFANLAGGGSSPGTLEIIAREYFRFQDPGRVIVEASPQLFTGLLQKQGSQQHGDYFGQNVGLPFALYVLEPAIARHIGSLRDIQKLENRAKWAQSRKIVGSRSERKTRQTRAGYTPERRHKLASIRVSLSRPVGQIRESEVFAAYRRLLDLLKDRGAEVCMVRTPVNQLFLELIADDEGFQDTLKALKQSARERGFRYLDFRDLPVKLEETHFGNEDHLAAEGAAVFAPAVVEACFPDGPDE